MGMGSSTVISPTGYHFLARGVIWTHGGPALLKGNLSTIGGESSTIIRGVQSRLPLPGVLGTVTSGHPLASSKKQVPQFLKTSEPYFKPGAGQLSRDSCGPDIHCLGFENWDSS